MVRGKRHELGISKDDVLDEQRLDGNDGLLMISYLEVVDDTFSIKVIIGDRKEVPVEGLAPGILLSW